MDNLTFSYTVVSANDEKVVIDFTINGEDVTETFDARHIPTDSKVALEEFCTRYAQGYAIGKAREVAVTTVSDDIKDLIGKPQDIVA